MAGISDDFDAVDFRSGIRSTMVMGLPQATELQPTFVFEEDATYAVADVAGHPFDWTATPATAPTRASVQVPCAIETEGTLEQFTTAGENDILEATLTVLDVDFALIEGFTAVLIGGHRFHFVRELPPLGLFEVTVHQFIVRRGKVT